MKLSPHPITGGPPLPGMEGRVCLRSNGGAEGPSRGPIHSPVPQTQRDTEVYK